MVTIILPSGRTGRYTCIGTPEESAECEQRLAEILLRGYPTERTPEAPTRTTSSGTRGSGSPPTPRAG